MTARPDITRRQALDTKERGVMATAISLSSDQKDAVKSVFTWKVWDLEATLHGVVDDWLTAGEEDVSWLAIDNARDRMTTLAALTTILFGVETRHELPADADFLQLESIAAAKLAEDLATLTSDPEGRSDDQAAKSRVALDLFRSLGSAPETLALVAA